MEQYRLEQSVERALAAAEEFQQTVNQLPLRIRSKILRQLQPNVVDDDYLPWGGLFPSSPSEKRGLVIKAIRVSEARSASKGA